MAGKIYKTASGMPLFQMPIGRSERANAERRNITDLGRMTAACALSQCGIRPDAPLIFCGSQSKAIPFLQQFMRMSAQPFLLIGTQRDLEDSCLLRLGVDWTDATVERELPSGNGALVLAPGGDTTINLKHYVSDWHSHLLIFCLGNGWQLDHELLSQLNVLGRYILLSASLNRSVKSSDGCRLEPSALLSSMEYILVSSIGTAARDLISILPSYERETVSNAVDYSSHRDFTPLFSWGRRNGRGFRISQSRTLETKPILTQEELVSMQDNNTLLLYNARLAHTWVARIER